MAFVNEIINQARIYLNDAAKVEYSDNELLAYFNDALSFCENALCTAESGLLLTETNIITSPAVLPSDFLKLYKCEKEGKALIYKEAGKFLAEDEYSLIGNKLYSGKVPLTLYYYAAYARIATLNANIDIYKPLITYIKDFIVIKALNRNEYNSQSEVRQLSELSGLIIAAAKKREGITRIRR